MNIAKITYQGGGVTASDPLSENDMASFMLQILAGRMHTVVATQRHPEQQHFVVEAEDERGDILATLSFWVGDLGD